MEHDEFVTRAKFCLEFVATLGDTDLRAETDLRFIEDIAIRQIYLEESGHRQKFTDTIRKVGDLKKRIEKLKFKTKGRQAWSMIAYG
jgi:hypothetical protein